MRGNGVAVVKVAHPGGVEGDCLVFAVELGRYAAVCDALDGGKVAVGHVDLLRGRGELDAVALREVAANLLVTAHSLQALRVVGHFCSVLAPNGDAVRIGVNSGDVGCKSLGEAGGPCCQCCSAVRLQRCSALPIAGRLR